MQRDQFLKLALSGLVAVPFISWAERASVRGRKVIIVGAGMAGAAAARKLRDAGCEVVVLEARSRTGGRIHTHTDGGVNIELGANWIHQATHPDNPLMGYANQLNLEIHQTDYSNLRVYDQKGERIATWRLGLFYRHVERMLNKQSALLNGNGNDTSLGAAMAQLARDKNYSSKERAMFALIEESYANNLGADLSDASAAHYLSKSVRKESSDFFVTGGYNRIVNHLLAGVEVRTNHVVREIRNVSERVEVITDQQVFEADFTIITVPISVLQNNSIAFTPPLPEWKVNSFSSMHMGVFNKVIMEFSEKFWSGDAHFQCYLTEQGSAFGIAVNGDHYTRKPILIAMPVGSSAEWVEGRDPDTLKSTWQNILHKVHPGKEIEFKNMLVTQWKGDPFSQGSYSHVPVGATENDLINLRKEVGRVHFAGEATVLEHHATVHGAYLSGVREAEKILSY